MKTPFQTLLKFSMACVVLLLHKSGHADALQDYLPSAKYEVFSAGVDQLKAGNYAPIDMAANDLELLWSYYLWAQGDISKRIADRLAVIPGHAQYVADMVETITTTEYNQRQPVPAFSGRMPRAYAFRILDELGELGTPEAIQQIGRFLWDKRNPDFTENPFNGMLMPNMFNSRFAVRALNKALGDKSPIAGKFDASEMIEPGEYSAQIIREWWASDASLPFRQPLPGVPLPDIVRNPPKVPHVDLERYKPSPPRPLQPTIRLPRKEPSPEVTAKVKKMIEDNRTRKPHPRALPSRPSPIRALAPNAEKPSTPQSTSRSQLWQLGLIATASLACLLWLHLRSTNYK